MRAAHPDSCETERRQYCFDVKGWHQLSALKRGCVIQRSHIVAARQDPSIIHGWKRGKMASTYIPELMTVGSFFEMEDVFFRHTVRKTLPSSIWRMRITID
jgi:hypothetical protein